MFSEGFVYKDKQAVTLSKGKFPHNDVFVTQLLDIVNYLYTNRIEVTPEDWKKFLAPFVRLCYDPSLPFNVRGPKFFANLLFLIVNFQKRGHPDESLSMEEIDYEIQKLKRTMFGD